jgi:hypothetical protein
MCAWARAAGWGGGAAKANELAKLQPPVPYWDLLGPHG